MNCFQGVYWLKLQRREGASSSLGLQKRKIHNTCGLEHSLKSIRI
ncbi:Protein of unknown function [Gryllus bimaculatus]|nr:Protein of unknown function [Gryllus bimaculatus]